jgi:hypothetical protein
MTHARRFLASAAVIALTLGITGQTMAPVETEEPLSTNDILVVTNDAGSSPGQTNAQESAKMGQENGTQQGDDLGAVPQSDTAKIDQPPSRNPTTGENSSE